MSDIICSAASGSHKGICVEYKSAIIDFFPNLLMISLDAFPLICPEFPALAILVTMGEMSELELDAATEAQASCASGPLILPTLNIP